MEIYGRIRSINVELDTQQYKLANQAVDQGNMLRLIGALSIKKQRGEITKLKKIDILIIKITLIIKPPLSGGFLYLDEIYFVNIYT
ncbi:Uncharacterised protein [Rodentibacter pneumotropicus]|uniref:Uncharacterized protein n=1 Tax=Rodentibacter pneumotropicus TaxID=758 RepID=A0A3S5ES52_9PAST|nr:Uncharacterised protein [Rodentibacter pneumotropicus]